MVLRPGVVRLRELSRRSDFGQRWFVHYGAEQHGGVLAVHHGLERSHVVVCELELDDLVLHQSDAHCVGLLSALLPCCMARQEVVESASCEEKAFVVSGRQRIELEIAFWRTALGVLQAFNVARVLSAEPKHSGALQNQVTIPLRGQTHALSPRVVGGHEHVRLNLCCVVENQNLRLLENFALIVKHFSQK